MGTSYVFKDPVERLDNDFVLHSFFIVSTDPLWYWLRPDIDVNQAGQISCNGSDWHGLAAYDPTPGSTSWRMTFNPRAQLDRMHTLIFVRIEDTHAFICLDEERRYNGVLIPKIRDPDEWST